MRINKFISVFAFIVIAQTAVADPKFEIPVLKLVKVNFNEVDSSSKPDVMWRQFEYTSSASAKDLLEFYQSSKHVKSCDYNDMADNYLCSLKKHGKVSSGYVFIPSKINRGEVTILADYFFYQ